MLKGLAALKHVETRCQRNSFPFSHPTSPPSLQSSSLCIYIYIDKYKSIYIYIYWYIYYNMACLNNRDPEGYCSHSISRLVIRAYNV